MIISRYNQDLYGTLLRLIEGWDFDGSIWSITVFSQKTNGETIETNIESRVLRELWMEKKLDVEVGSTKGRKTRLYTNNPCMKFLPRSLTTYLSFPSSESYTKVLTCGKMTTHRSVPIDFRVNWNRVVLPLTQWNCKNKIIIPLLRPS